MGFPHCPICVVLAFVSVFMGITRSYMFYILFREFLSICWSCLLYKNCYKTLVISMDSVFLLIDIFILRIILLLMLKEGLIMKKIIKFFKLLKRRIDILNAETELKFILENK